MSGALPGSVEVATAVPFLAPGEANHITGYALPFYAYLQPNADRVIALGGAIQAMEYAFCTEFKSPR